jgi:hypothetical protein
MAKKSSFIGYRLEARGERLEVKGEETTLLHPPPHYSKGINNNRAYARLARLFDGL